MIEYQHSFCLDRSVRLLLCSIYLALGKTLHQKIFKYHGTLGHLSSNQCILISMKLTKYWRSAVSRISKTGPKSISPNVKMENGPITHLASYLTKTQEKTFSRNLHQAMGDIMVSKSLLIKHSQMTCRLMYYTYQISSGCQGSGTLTRRAMLMRLLL